MMLSFIEDTRLKQSANQHNSTSIISFFDLSYKRTFLKCAQQKAILLFLSTGLNLRTDIFLYLRLKFPLNFNFLLINKVFFVFVDFAMLNIYNKALTSHPILTKMFTSGTIFSLGDYITQAVVDRKLEIDKTRNKNWLIVGAVYIAPMLHMWYCKVLPTIGKIIFKQTTSKFVRVLASVGLDQLLFAPILIGGFYISKGLVKDFSSQGIKNAFDDYRQKFWQTLKANWKIWPIASTINFSLIAVQYRVLFSNCVGLFWNVILSYIANNKKSPSQTIRQKLV